MSCPWLVLTSVAHVAIGHGATASSPIATITAAATAAATAATAETFANSDDAASTLEPLRRVEWDPFARRRRAPSGSYPAGREFPRAHRRG